MVISVVIPTLNSEATLEACLQSIEASRGVEVEVILVDGGSRDATAELARGHDNVRVLQYSGKLLGARLTGIEAARGDYLMMMDSDQHLFADSLLRAVEKCRDGGYDALVMEESSHEPRNWLEHLIATDRRMLGEIGEQQLHPVYGASLARFFSAELLRNAVGNIPQDLRPLVWAHDHAIIYYEACMAGARVSVLPNAISHTEMSQLSVLLRKYFRYGRQAVKYIDAQRYQDVFFKKERLRYGASSTRSYAAMLASIILLFLKGVPYKLGFYTALPQTWSKRQS